MMTMPVTNPTTSAAEKQTHHHHDHHPLLANVYLLNNLGCEHLRDGHHHQALNSFKAAFATIKAVLIAHGGTAVPQTPPRYPRRLLPMSADVLRTHLSTTTMTVEEEDSTSTTTTATTTARRRRQEECHYFTFTNGIPCIPGHHFSTDLIEEGQIVSAIVLFNLAATTHLQASSTLCYYGSAAVGEPHGYHHQQQQQHHHQQQQQAALRSAQSLYFCASHLVGPLLLQQDQLRGATRHGRNAAFDLLSLALFNNIAITHWECREFLQAEEAFARLAIISHSAHSSFGGTGSHQPPQQNRDDEALLFKVKSMIFNATVGGPVPVSIAPAA